MFDKHNILIKAHYELLMLEFDYKMWFYDFCHLTHVSENGPIFLYTIQGLEIKNEYSNEAMKEAINLFENRML